MELENHVAGESGHAEEFEELLGRYVANPVWKRVRLALGLTPITLGAIGPLSPIMPGIPLLIGGVTPLDSDHLMVRRLKERLRQWRTKREGSQWIVRGAESLCWRSVKLGY